MPIAIQADVEAVLQNKFTDGADDKVAASLAVAQSLLEAEAGFPFDEASVTNKLTGDATELLWTTLRPVTAVTSIVEDGDTLTDDVDFAWWTSGKLLRLGGYSPYPWSVTPNGVVVTYTAGWADHLAAPQALRWVCAMVAARFWQSGFAFAQLADADAVPLGIKQEVIGGYSVTYTEDIGKGVQLLPSEAVVARRLRRGHKSVLT